MPATFYNQNTHQLEDIYRSETLDQMHQPWIEYFSPILNKSHAHILDLGSRAGHAHCIFVNIFIEQGAFNGNSFKI